LKEPHWTGIPCIPPLPVYTSVRVDSKTNQDRIQRIMQDELDGDTKRIPPPALILSILFHPVILSSLPV